MENNIRYIRIGICLIVVVALFIACSNKKNTAVNRLYHDINTRYNVHFNANEAYEETLKAKKKNIENTSNFSDLLHLYPMRLDTTNSRYKGQFTKTIDKTSKAIKVHSISRKPQIDRSRIKDEKYKNWIRNKEFNPFLVNTWLLLADAQLEEEDYLQAIATSIYISKIYENDPEVVAIAKLNLVRAYSEMGWIYEAENQLRKIEQEKLITYENENEYNSLKTNLLIRTENYQESISFLKRAIETEKNGTEKRRKRYLLAQLYEQVGDKQQALEAYSKIKGLSLPFVYELNVGLKKIELTDLSTAEKIKQLEKFGKKTRFRTSQYKIYDIIGDVYMSDKDTVNAIKSFQKSLFLFEQSNIEKAILDLKLGEIFYSQEKYVQAQPLYAEALSIIKKDFKNYSEVAFRSEVLDELAIYSKTIHEQDSLLHVALLPEDERIQFIEDYIEKLKEEEKRKKEAEERKLKQMEDEINRIDNAWQNPDLVSAVVDKYKTEKEAKYDFYFYNPSIVTQGKTSFQSVWGKRVLEDNWRNSDKTLTFGIDDIIEDEEDEEKVKAENAKVDLSKDIYSVQYYLQQLPLTPEAQDKANDMIDDAMFNLALVYRYLLDHPGLTIDTFLEELKRYPDTPHKEEIYYQLFLVYLQKDDIESYRYYRDLILADYPDSKYAAPLSENDFAWNFKYINKMQEDMYEKAYDAYLHGDVSTVINNYQTLQTKYPFASLMGNFAFLDALTYAQTKDIIKLEEKLKELVKTYPNEDFIPLAEGILKNIKNGMVILSDGAIIQSIDWQQAYQSKIAEALTTDSIDVFASTLDEPYVLLLNFADNTIDRNDLLYDVADFNFSNFMVKTFDMAFLNDSIGSSLIISTFDDSDDLQSYLETLHEDPKLDYLKKWKGQIIPVAMTKKVYQSVLPLSGIQVYIDYYDKNLSKQYPILQDNTALTLEDFNKMELLGDKLPDARKDSLNDAGTKNVYEEDLLLVDKPIDRPNTNQSIEKTPDNELDLNKAVGKDVMDVLQGVDNLDKKVDNILDDISQNPLEGIKNIFKKNTIEDNLSKEEKAELKEWKKEQARIEKFKLDSIGKVEQLKVDSIAKIEQMRIDAIDSAEKARTDSIQQVRQQKIDADKIKRQVDLQKIKEAEQRRKDKAKDLEQLRKQKMNERNQKQKEMEQRRKEKMKEQDARRKQLQREREQKLKDRK